MTKEKLVTIRLTEKDVAKLDEVAEKTHLPRSRIARYFYRSSVESAIVNLNDKRAIGEFVQDVLAADAKDKKK